MENAKKEAGFEEYPISTIMVENLAFILWIVLGALAASYVSMEIAIAYVAFAAIMLLFVLRKLLCTHCHYYGKWCHIGWGKLTALLFARGNPEEFNTGLGQKLVPVTYGLLMMVPILALIFSMLGAFTLEKLGLLIAIFLVSGYSGFIARKKSCAVCKMRCNCKGCAVKCHKT
jgi:hypothetical protein